MIILVNIGKSLSQRKSYLEATRRKWKLNLERCKECQWVVGVANGEAKCFFFLDDVFPDPENPSRVAFDLSPCIAKDEENIRKILTCNETNLKGIQRGKYLRAKYK